MASDSGMRKYIIALFVLVAFCVSAWDATEFDWMFATLKNRQTPSWTPADLSPIRWYKCDGNSVDAVSTNAASWSGIARYTTGINGQAWKFDGTNYLTAARCDASITNATVAFWVRRWGDAINYCGIGGLSAPDGGITFQGRSQYIIANSLDDSTRYDITLSAEEMPGNNWMHVVVTWTNKIASAIWQNGTKHINLTSSTRYSASGRYNMMMGARMLASATNATLVAPIELDDMLIFDKVLSNEEIQQIYEWRDTP